MRWAGSVRGTALRRQGCKGKCQTAEKRVSANGRAPGLWLSAYASSFPSTWLGSQGPARAMQPNAQALPGPLSAGAQQESCNQAAPAHQCSSATKRFPPAPARRKGFGTLLQYGQGKMRPRRRPAVLQVRELGSILLIAQRPALLLPPKRTTSSKTTATLTRSRDRHGIGCVPR